MAKASIRLRFLSACLAVAASAAPAADRPAVAIAAFDNYDTSGEAAERQSMHAALVDGFNDLLGARLDARGIEVIAFHCAPHPRCAAGALPPEDFIAAARRSGAEFVVYGGVHKMSTLVQIGKVHVLDLDGDRLLLDQTFSFRGDDPTAFARAADFLVRYIAALDLDA